MTSQVNFKIDRRLKERAMKKAENEGVTYSNILKMATAAYVKGKLNVQLVAEKEFNAKTRKEIEKAIKDVKAGRNLSPIFDSADEAVAYLKSQN